MKTSTSIRWPALGAWFWLLLATSQAAPLGTGITYKGHLTDGSQAATGLYGFQVALYDDATNGNKIGPTIILLEVGVTNGAFTLPLDFGPDAFSGDVRWLENSVRTNGEASYTRLSPRQAIGQIPYALHATAASTATSVPASALTGTVPDAALSPVIRVATPPDVSVRWVGTVRNTEVRY
jgi:hypothetical protein